MTRKFSPRLALHTFEERITPASTSFKYDGSSRTLTLTAVNADTLTVSAVPNRATSFITVTDAGAHVIFTSDIAKTEVVRHLVVRFDKVDTGTLILDNTVRLGSDLTVFGAKKTQTITSDGVYGDGIFFHGTANSDDTLTFGGITQTGKKVDLELGGGTNVVNIDGGFIGGDLIINGGVVADTVNVLAAGDLRVNGAVKINLGDGRNLLQAAGSNLFDVGKSFNYQGGIDKDDIHLRSVDANSFDSTLRAGSDAKFRLDTQPAIGGANDVQLNRVTLGGNLAIEGGGGADTVQISGLVTVGGDFKSVLHGGTNYVDPNYSAIGGNRIGGSYKYTGGSDEDEVWLDGFTVALGIDVSLGNCPVNTPDPEGQFFKAGTYVGDTIYGKVKIKSGAHGVDTVALHRMYIGGGTDINLGGSADILRFDDVDISGSSKVDMGDGNDTLSVEMVVTDSAGDLTGKSFFGGIVEFKGGLGDDTFNLARSDGDATSKLQFGPHVTIEGDDGSDTLNIGADCVFLGTGNLETCEKGDNPF
jgi:hypothetical protein